MKHFVHLCLHYQLSILRDDPENDVGIEEDQNPHGVYSNYLKPCDKK